MSDAAQHLGILTWVTTLAVLLVTLVRAPLRSALGARAAYWLWLAVPASALALLLPQVAQPEGNTPALMPDALGWLWAQVHGLTAALHLPGRFGALACMVWMAGAVAALVSMARRQRSFTRSLEPLAPLSDGTWRSRAVVAPMLVGALRPRVLLPLDFEQRYSAEEQEFVLAHERAHLRRGDALVNACGAAWLCVFWFNPLMFWAMRLLRFDQDLACDAAVLTAACRSRRGRYAEALLKAQLVGENASPMALACHWGAAHPLRQRIAALRRPVAGRVRHWIGLLCVAALVASVSLAARALEPAPQATRPITPTAATGTTRPPGGHVSGKVCPLSLRRAQLAAASSGAAKRRGPVSGVRTP